MKENPMINIMENDKNLLQNCTAVTSTFWHGNLIVNRTLETTSQSKLHVCVSIWKKAVPKTKLEEGTF